MERIFFSYPSIVPESRLLDRDDQINDTERFGKERGSTILMERFDGVLVYAIASGAGKDDPWFVQGSVYRHEE